jgi:hypothetical protein
LAQRTSRKRGRRQAPREAAAARPSVNPASAPQGRSQRRDAQARARLSPLAPGERPWPIVVGTLLTAASGLGNLIAWLAGAKIAGKHPAAGGILIFSALMLACAVGMWRLWYGAVLAFMVLLAIVIVLFSLLLIEASNALGFIVAPLIVIAAGFLFWKMVRVLSRIQMPKPPGGR